MFQQLPCTIELSEKLGRHHPEFMLPIRFQAENRLPLTKLELYSYTKGDTEYYYGLKIQKILKHELYITCLGAFIQEDFVEGFRIFSKTTSLLEDRKEALIVSDEHFTSAIQPILKEFKMEHEVFPNILYYISKEQEELLLKAEPLPVPEGYELGLSSLEDAKFITECWRHKQPGEEEQTRMKISVFPSTCIRFNGQPVAWELVHANGMLNHLYVLPEHRGKGLGHIVEQDMARRLIREGFIVYKTVEFYNKSVHKHSETSPFWSIRRSPDGEPITRVFMPVWPEEIIPFFKK